MAGTERLICAGTDLADGGRGVRFSVERPAGAVEAFAIRHGGRVYAYLNACGHIPAQLDWVPGEFFDDSKLYLICSVHGALYAPESGACLSGRCAGKGLKALRVRESENNIFLLTDDSDG
ncbi:MAG: Rieske 2Fe-2S domain-containing protein [Betaproteobacteria bacterium]|nr:Rieske 2Fe-2S domain-containing protein [Betaproteobacteria bacterium]